MTFWLNGAFREETRAIDVADRGFLLGDGVFETILLVDGVPAFWDAHRARLDDALEALRFPVRSDAFALTAARELAARARADAGAGVLRLTVARGPAGRGLAPPVPAEAAPTLLMTAQAMAPYPDEPAALVVSKVRRSSASLSSRFKTATYLDNLMARGDAAAAGADDALMLNERGRVVCASAANVFVLKDDATLATPPVGEGALPGTVRALLLARGAEAGFAVREAALAPAELSGRALILTNSLMGVRPAVIGGVAAPARADALLSRLQMWYRAVLTEDVEQRARQL